MPSSIRFINLQTDEKHFSATIDKWMKQDGALSLSDNINFFQQTTERYENMMTHPAYLAIKNETFDLVILGWFFNDFQIGVAEHFNAPLILSTSMKPTSLFRNYIGSPQSVSSVPSALLGYKTPMNFFQRLLNFFALGGEQIFGWVFHQFFAKPRYEKYFPSTEYRSFEEAQKNVALILLSHHFTQGTPEAYLPGLIDVGGMHIKNNPKPLPTV